MYLSKICRMFKRKVSCTVIYLSISYSFWNDLKREEKRKKNQRVKRRKNIITNGNKCNVIFHNFETL